MEYQYLNLSNIPYIERSRINRDYCKVHSIPFLASGIPWSNLFDDKKDSKIDDKYIRDSSIPNLVMGQKFVVTKDTNGYSYRDAPKGTIIYFAKYGYDKASRWSDIPRWKYSFFRFPDGSLRAMTKESVTPFDESVTPFDLNFLGEGI